MFPKKLFFRSAARFLSVDDLNLGNKFHQNFSTVAPAVRFLADSACALNSFGADGEVKGERVNLLNCIQITHKLGKPKLIIFAQRLSAFTLYMHVLAWTLVKDAQIKISNETLLSYIAILSLFHCFVTS